MQKLVYTTIYHFILLFKRCEWRVTFPMGKNFNSMLLRLIEVKIIARRESFFLCVLLHTEF